MKSVAESIQAGAFEAAQAYVATGLSVIPVKLDGSKSPAFKDWRQFAERLPTAAELDTWFGSGRRYGVGIPGGKAAGNLLVFDFEQWHPFTVWGAKITALERSFLEKCPVIGTPKGGAHVYVRLTAPMKGCKYARDQKGATLIETRGDNHFVVAPGSPPPVHPTSRPYRLIRAGWFDGTPFEPMPIDMFNGLAAHAADLNEYVRPAPRETVGDHLREGEVGTRPGDVFNARISWGEILRPAGWTVFRSAGSTTFWSRPGKSPAGVSASTGFCKGPSGHDLLYVFSSNGLPFEAERSYSRFAAYALLNHHGDFKAATRALGRAGYGASMRKAVRR